MSEYFGASREFEPPYLRGSRCRHCQRAFFPVKSFCPICLQRESIETVSLSRYGILQSFTVVHTAPEGFIAPYALGYIDLPEDIRIFSMLEECEPTDKKLKIGQKMELMRVGAQYRFRPAGN